ncbi:MAG TPA: methylene-tetrahydromethanopterin dehydrogenase N-terminal domain-containing protein [Candidatus Polarisedimenticolia bacterium]|nr:methylene-tetrahydromethanopterin dehydrogenase N-terminal domain-containing protein [Candidatus Polarisedimenticolia bacterium]
MERKRLLYLVSSDPRVSPFDINMAYDAGFDVVIPYAGVNVSHVAGLIQDIMFSRGPKGVRCSSVFFSGSDLTAAEGMLQAASAALFEPFLLGLMIDPKGGYTTAAAILARVAALARAKGLGDLARLRVLVAAGTGGVGKTAAALAARDGARVTLTSRRADAAATAAREVAALFQAGVEPRAAPTESDLVRLAQEADVVLATGAAGARLLTQASLLTLRGPKVMADVNAVPPAGLEGLQPQDEGREIAPGLFGLGPLAIGALKSRVEAALLRDLLTAERPPVIDSRAARRKADEILAAP